MSDLAAGWLIAAIFALCWVIFRCTKVILIELKVANHWAEASNGSLLQIDQTLKDANADLSSMAPDLRSINEEIGRIQSDLDDLRRRLAPSEAES